MNSSKYYTKIKSEARRLALKNRPLHREITHKDYNEKVARNIVEGEKGSALKILSTKMKFSEEHSESDLSKRYEERYREDNEYWEMPTDSYGSPKTYGGVSLLVVMVFSVIHLTGNDEIKGYALFLYLIALLVTILHVSYYITMPKNKEHILDRLQGTITFPGFFWEPNNTMPFKKIKVFIPSGGTNAIAAAGLRLLSPLKFRGSFFFNIGSSKSYENMTLLTWYMDKNRPLPPLRRLKPHREKDFERRKAEGFPPPLYPAFFHTHEATSAQQAERNKYWREEITTDKKGTTTCNIYRGNEIFDFKTRKWFNLEGLEKREDGEYYYKSDV
jgi:hypothetical protein